MVNLKKIKKCAFITTFGLSVILASVSYPDQGEKVKNEALASSINRDGSKLQVKHKTDIFITEWGQTNDDTNVSLFTQNNAKLQDIIDGNSRLEKVAEGFKFTEGPLWHPDGFLLFSDIPTNTIYQWKPR